MTDAAHSPIALQREGQHEDVVGADTGQAPDPEVHRALEGSRHRDGGGAGVDAHIVEYRSAEDAEVLGPEIAPRGRILRHEAVLYSARRHGARAKIGVILEVSTPDD